MKVKDAIKKLQELDPEAEIVSSSKNPELRGAIIPISLIHQFKGEKRKESFRDMMDSIPYDKEVIKRHNGDKGDNFVEFM